MSEINLKKIADKIAKCLALATSDNPAEAAAAKRQADALMHKYNLTMGDVASSAVHEESVNIPTTNRPPVYLSQLAYTIAKAFGCSAINTVGYDVGIAKQNTRVQFIGLGIKPELAAYTFDVLRSQISRDRKTYADTLNKRLKRATKIRRADLFCQAWVYRIALQVNEFAGTEQERAAIDAYKERAFGELSPDARTGATVKNISDKQAQVDGYDAAKDVALHKPVQQARNQRLGNAH